MRFYIFANEKDGSFTTPVNEAVYSSTDYRAVREQFDIINREFKYRNSYLVADLNVVEFKQGMFTRPVSINKDSILTNKYLPFFVIGEFHYGKDEAELSKYIDPNTSKFDPNRTIRHDAVSIKLPGFTQQFYNNQSAILSYLHFVDNSYYATLEIQIAVDNPSRREPVIINRLLGTTTTTKKKISHQGFNKLELPGKVSECYTSSKFEERKPPKFFNLKECDEDIKEEIGDVFVKIGPTKNVVSSAVIG